MKTYTACIWIILAVLMLGYLIWRNIRLTKILRRAMDEIDESRKRCDRLIQQLQSCEDAKERMYLMQKMREEEKAQRELFADEKEWPGQRKRIREHMQDLRDYLMAADEIEKKMHGKA